MRKRVVEKGNIHKSDFLRALVTDTLPGDVPIIVSNDCFYRNAKRESLNLHHKEFILSILAPTKYYTIPYRYNILRAGGSSRRLSLVHPSGQMAVATFYRDYGEVICYLCRKSEASIRSPRKIGSLFYVKGALSEKNTLKGSSIDTVDIESAVSNPASYFSYQGVDRAFKFFMSSDYLRLEKRYAVMHYADIAKCFSSIYTHTLFWANADIHTAKNNVKSSNISNVFDKLMQQQNFNETNGICVGAEVSRIFAELILSEADRRIISKLDQKSSGDRLHFKVDYEFRRYVDDYYIFCKDIKTSEAVLAAIRSSLSDFKLHLNDEKTRMVSRPFITVKSRMIRDAETALSNFFEKFIENVRGGKFMCAKPKRVRRPIPLIRSFLDSIKASCYDNQEGYNAVSNYLIGALANRVSLLVSGYEYLEKAIMLEEEYIGSLLVLLESTYFMYEVDPSVTSSLRVAQSAIQIFEFVKGKFPDRAAFVAEQIVRWTFQFITGMSGSKVHAVNDCTPLEALNLLLVVGEVGREEIFAKQAIKEFCGPSGDWRYFEIVSYLYCIKDDKAMVDLRTELFEQAKAIVIGKDKCLVEAEAAYLGLDILSCPYINLSERAKLFIRMRTNASLSQITVAEAEQAVKEFEANPWFVDWRGLSLLRMIRKKELSAVY